MDIRAGIIAMHSIATWWMGSYTKTDMQISSTKYISVEPPKPIGSLTKQDFFNLKGQ
jgi:hypothetical protein